MVTLDPRSVSIEISFYDSVPSKCVPFFEKIHSRGVDTKSSIGRKWGCPGSIREGKGERGDRSVTGRFGVRGVDRTYERSSLLTYFTS